LPKLSKTQRKELEIENIRKIINFNKRTLITDKLVDIDHAVYCPTAHSKEITKIFSTAAARFPLACKTRKLSYNQGDTANYYRKKTHANQLQI
jgi:hypothetical protein